MDTPTVYQLSFKTLKGDESSQKKRQETSWFCIHPIRERSLGKIQTDQQLIQHQDYLQDKTHFKEFTDENQTRKETPSNIELHL
jgi:hypothetical protein